MTPQDKVNKLARKLVDEYKSVGPTNTFHCLRHNLEEALNKLDGEAGKVAGEKATKYYDDIGTEIKKASDALDKAIRLADVISVEAKIGCWLTRDGSKAVVNNKDDLYDNRPFSGFIYGNIRNQYFWRIDGTLGEGLRDMELLTFISPDVDYWEKEAKKPVGDGITDDTNALQAVLDKSKPFDPSQLPVSFVVSLGEFGSHFPPLRISERGIAIFNSSTKDGYQFYTYEQLAEANALWSTDRKTWREFK